MTSRELRTFMLYLYNVEIETFAKDIYDKDFIDSYIQEKYQKMQRNLLHWLGELDCQHLNRLAKIVSEKSGEYDEFI